MTPLLLHVLLALQCPAGCEAGVGGGPSPAPSGQFLIQAGGTSARVKAAVATHGACGPGAGTSCGVQLLPCGFEVTVQAATAPGAFVAISYGSAFPTPRWVVLPQGLVQTTDPMAVPCGHDGFVWAVVFDAATFAVLAEEQVLLHCAGCEPD